MPRRTSPGGPTPTPRRRRADAPQTAIEAVRDANEQERLLGAALRAGTVIQAASSYGASDVQRIASNSEHARFSPSSAYRWLACPRSVSLHEELQRQPGYIAPLDGEPAIRGRAMHAVAEQKIKARLGMAYSTAPLADLTTDEYSTVNTYANYVCALVDEIKDLSGREPDVLVEARLTSHLSDCWGTCDTVIISHITHEVWVIDLKTGHQRVDPENNAQLMIYANGVRRSVTQLSHMAHVEYRKHLVIVQPQDDVPVKTWTMPSGNFHNDFANQMTAAIVMADELATRFHTGDHCTYCPAASICPALRDRTLSVFDDSRELTSGTSANVQSINAQPEISVEMPNVAAVTPNQMSFFLRNRVVIRNFLEAVESAAITNPPPGFKVVEGNTRRRWTDPARVVELLRAGHPELIRTMPPTIGECERVVGRDVTNGMTTTPRGAPMVVPDSDRRPAITPGAQVFNIEREADVTRGAD